MEIKRVGLIVNDEKDHHLEITQNLIDELRKNDIEVFVSKKIAERLKVQDKISILSSPYKRVNMIFSLGGDGTLLRAARLVAAHGIPICI